MGGGIGLLSVCDIVIASKTAHFAFSEVKLGLTPSTISPYVIAAIGERRAQYYFLTGEIFNATEAHKIGLVHQLSEEEALFSTAATIAKRLLLNGPNALMAVKSLIRQVANEKITPILSEQSAMHLAHLRISPEAQEGLKAFMEKRVPKWS
jgi:methylglutaconyl-CoA hydratase